MPKSRVRIPDELAGLLRAEWERAITEANLGVEDTIIARLCLIDRLPQMDAAVELDIDRSTVSRRLPHIMMRVRMAAERTRAGV